MGLAPHPLWFIKFGGVARGELLTPEAAKSDLPFRPGIYAGYVLRRIKLIEQPAYPLEIQSRLDFYLTDLSGPLRMELLVQSKLFFRITDWLTLTASHRLFLFDTKERPTAVTNDFALGLNVGWDLRLQTF